MLAYMHTQGQAIYAALNFIHTNEAQLLVFYTLLFLTGNESNKSTKTKLS